jgi:hypothetical protein
MRPTKVKDFSHIDVVQGFIATQAEHRLAEFQVPG